MLVVLLIAAFVLAALIYLGAVLYWQERQILGLRYFGLSRAGRERTKRILRAHSRILTPLVWVLSRMSRFAFSKMSFTHRGITGPRRTCTPESFDRAASYEPQAQDVFVVTQMRCGTTWMQQVVYEILCRGAGDLVRTETTLYAVSPWLEALTGVSVADAPYLGSERPSRVIKTHLPASLCPIGAEARYIYVARHPVSCFVSCADFIAANAGPLAPELDTLEQWFCSPDLMWWGSWPDHVQGWWDQAQTRQNVLFLRFEDMHQDLPAVVGQVTTFLGMEPLSSEEAGKVVERCSFEYMRRHAGIFEMHPPRLFAVDRELLVRGSADRHRDVAEPVRRRISAWCAATMRNGSFSLARMYPDVV